LLAGDSSLDGHTNQWAKKVADHYSNRTNQTREEREASPIIHLKKLNNWVTELHYVVICFFVSTLMHFRNPINVPYQVGVVILDFCASGTCELNNVCLDFSYLSVLSICDLI
jgi:hypothetical protein